MIVRPEFKRRGHAHFWQRAAAHSRRNFLGAMGGAVAAGLALPNRMLADSSTLPNPIPGGLDLLSLVGAGPGPIFHVYLPGTAPELSTITDFNGMLGQAEVLGPWSGGNDVVAANSQYDADMRFMTGEYIGRDGKHHQGTFAFA